MRISGKTDCPAVLWFELIAGDESASITGLNGRNRSAAGRASTTGHKKFIQLNTLHAMHPFPGAAKVNTYEEQVRTFPETTPGNFPGMDNIPASYRNDPVPIADSFFRGRCRNLRIAGSYHFRCSRIFPVPFPGAYMNSPEVCTLYGKVRYLLFLIVRSAAFVKADQEDTEP